MVNLKKALHALQIEVKRALYMNERTFAKTKNFALVKRDLRHLCEVLFDSLHELLKDRPAAAE